MAYAHIKSSVPDAPRFQCGINGVGSADCSVSLEECGADLPTLGAMFRRQLANIQRLRVAFDSDDAVIGGQNVPYWLKELATVFEDVWRLANVVLRLSEYMLLLTVVVVSNFSVDKPRVFSINCCVNCHRFQCGQTEYFPDLDAAKDYPGDDAVEFLLNTHSAKNERAKTTATATVTSTPTANVTTSGTCIYKHTTCCIGNIASSQSVSRLVGWSVCPA